MTPCTPHWFVFPPPESIVTVGVCKNCGATTTGSNVFVGDLDEEWRQRSNPGIHLPTAKRRRALQAAREVESTDARTFVEPLARRAR